MVVGRGSATGGEPPVANRLTLAGSFNLLLPPFKLEFRGSKSLIRTSSALFLHYCHVLCSNAAVICLSGAVVVVLFMLSPHDLVLPVFYM